MMSKLKINDLKKYLKLLDRQQLEKVDEVPCFISEEVEIDIHTSDFRPRTK